jgi:acyl-CoA reductase-like NAD-dependent aldehyde dehydrogenase
MTSTTISIAKFNRSNYKQWSGEMALLLEQKQVYGIVTGEDERPEDLAEQDATTAVKLAHRAAVKDWVTQHGTARSTILLGMWPRLQASYIEITDVQTLWEETGDGVQGEVEVRCLSDPGGAFRDKARGM